MKKKVMAGVVAAAVIAIVVLLVFYWNAEQGEGEEVNQSSSIGASISDIQSEDSLQEDSTQSAASSLPPETDHKDGPNIPEDLNITGNIYYISKSSGSDENTGLSPDTAWETLERASITAYKPGDAVLFKSGDTWEGTVRLHGTGSEQSPVYIGSYGSARKPVINGNGMESERALFAYEYSEISGAIEIIEGDYWRIDGLEITNYMPGDSIKRAGILALDNCETEEEFFGTPQRGLIIENCNIHDVSSDSVEKRTGGIVIMGNWNDVVIDNNKISNVSVSGIRNVSWNPNRQVREHYQQNYKIANNSLKNISGDGIVFTEVENGVIEYNFIDGYCTGDPSKDYAGVWTWASKDVKIQYNEITGGLQTENSGTAFGVDWYNKNVLIQYNYTHSNYNGISMFPQNSTGTVFRYNISINDGINGNTALFPYAVGDEETAPMIYNNLFYQSSEMNSTKLLNNAIGVNDLYMKFDNNILILSESLQLSRNNNISFGHMEGNVFLPREIVDNSWDKLGTGVSVDNNTMMSRSDLLIRDIQIGREPKGLITGYNTFDAHPLEEFSSLNKIFKSPDTIRSGVNAELSLGDKAPAQSDFFGNALIPKEGSGEAAEIKPGISQQSQQTEEE